MSNNITTKEQALDKIKELENFIKNIEEKENEVKLKAGQVYKSKTFPFTKSIIFPAQNNKFFVSGHGSGHDDNQFGKFYNNGELADQAYIKENYLDAGGEKLYGTLQFVPANNKITDFSIGDVFEYQPKWVEGGRFFKISILPAGPCTYVMGGGFTIDLVTHNYMKIFNPNIVYTKQEMLDFLNERDGKYIGKLEIVPNKQ